MHIRIALALILAIALLLAGFNAPARASCWGGFCDDVICRSRPRSTCPR